MQYRYLFTPAKIGSLTLKNRVVMMAMHHLYTEDGKPTPRFSEYYYRRALGGTALVICGSCRFEDYGSKAHTMSLRRDDQIEPWREFNHGMHERGCLTAVQLYHSGRYMPKKDSPAGRSLSASATTSGYTREQAEEMTLGEISDLLVKYEEGAARAVKAGFDAIEINGAVGYLLSQFLSPLTNLRTDEYGGSWENRYRLPLQVVAAVRRGAGEDYPIIFKMSASDMMPGSLGEKELIDFAVLLEQAGVDCIDVTGGWHETKVPQLPADDPCGGQAFLAEQIKAAVKIPVMGGIRVNRPETAESLLAMDMCDFIAVGRPLIADPDWTKKAQRGLEPTIRTCLGCNQGCLSRTFFDKPIECFTNGIAGREYLYPENYVEVRKNIVVIGGGPAGCEFALRAAHRGHNVTLMEKRPVLGGRLLEASIVPTRYEFANLIHYYEAALEHEGVFVLTDFNATPESVKEFDTYDTVVLACGAALKEILVETDGSAVICTYEDVLRHNLVCGRNTVILGGDSIGCEISRLLVRETSLSPEQLYYLTVNKVTDKANIEHMLGSSRRKVTLVEPGHKIGVGFESGTGWPFFADMARLGVVQKKNTSLLRIENGCAVLQSENGEERIPCDTLVRNPQRHADEHLHEAYEEPGREVYVLGDAKAPGKAMYAIRSAAELGCTI